MILEEYHTGICHVSFQCRKWGGKNHLTRKFPTPVNLLSVPIQDFFFFFFFLTSSTISDFSQGGWVFLFPRRCNSGCGFLSLVVRGWGFKYLYGCTKGQGDQGEPHDENYILFVLNHKCSVTMCFKHEILCLTDKNS